MSNKEYKISIEGFEVGLRMYVESFITQIIAMGYSEDEIVAIDFEEEEMISYMSDGEIIKVTKALFITSNKIAKA
jgi:hypothetical protein